MKILVLVKAVRTDMVFDDIADREAFTINPYDLYALQHILSIKKEGDYISCISMGHIGSKQILAKCVALGADEAIWLNDPAFAGADTIATSYTLSLLIRKYEYDLILCGAKAVDGETAQVPAGVAERLGILCLSGTKMIDDIGKGFVVITRENEVWTEKIEVTLPALVAFNSFTTNMNTISMKNMRKALKTDISPVNISCIGADAKLCGMKGSKTKVLRTNPNVSYQNNSIYFEDVKLFSEYILRLIEKYK